MEKGPTAATTFGVDVARPLRELALIGLGVGPAAVRADLGVRGHRLVVTPERIVIDEARRAYTELALFDLACDGVVMNRMLPPDALGEPFFAHRAEVEAERLEEVEGAFAPMPIRVAPLREDEVSGIPALEAHGEALFAGGDPTAGADRKHRIRYGRSGDGYRVTIPLSGASAGGEEALDVVKLDDELLLRVGPRRRALKLPPRMVTCDLVAAKRCEDRLEVTLGPPERAGQPGAAPVEATVAADGAECSSRTVHTTGHQRTSRGDHFNTALMIHLRSCLSGCF